MPEHPGLAAETEALELDEIERKAAHLMHQWLERVVGELEGIASADLVEAAERAERAAQVLDVLERVFAGVAQIRETLD